MCLALCYISARHGDVVVAIPSFGELLECRLQDRQQDRMGTGRLSDRRSEAEVLHQVSRCPRRAVVLVGDTVTASLEDAAAGVSARQQPEQLVKIDPTWLTSGRSGVEMVLG